MAEEEKEITRLKLSFVSVMIQFSPSRAYQFNSIESYAFDFFRFPVTLSFG